ncbi:protein painting of fourth [Lutzomyia longipalpis]|uniref:protein painting of fourth n=1 Tax=Lutzomyia longipalpis TaxID=7200 RepID=UPI0024836F82|nr:protein painting of fourth [Lutzomyia longipalpis]
MTVFEFCYCFESGKEFFLDFPGQMKRRSEVPTARRPKRGIQMNNSGFSEPCPELFFPRTSNEIHIARNWRPTLPLQLQSLLLNPVRPAPPPSPPVPTPPPPPNPRPNPPEPPNQRASRREPKFRNWRKPTTHQTSDTNGDASMAKMLLIKFPDPKITRELVQKFSSSIDLVVFQQSVAPRQCLVRLHPEADVEAAIAELSRIPFGGGMISAELKNPDKEIKSNSLDEIDFCRIIVGNLPLNVPQEAIKGIFPTADSVEISPFIRLKSSQTAVFQFKSKEEAFDVYRQNRKLLFENRHLTIRFYRKRALANKSRVSATEKTPSQEERSPEKKRKADSGPLDGSSERDSISTETASERVESNSEEIDTKDNVFGEAAKLIEDFSSRTTPPYSPDITVKMEIEENPPSIHPEIPETAATAIKSELNETDSEELEDKIYEKLISAKESVEEHEKANEDDDEKSEVSQEETNDGDILKCSSNKWNVLRQDEELQLETVGQQGPIDCDSMSCGSFLATSVFGRTNQASLVDTW